MTTQTGIAQALRLFDDSPTKLAAAIGFGVLRQHVEHWSKTGRVPAERCHAICRVAPGVAVWDLRPDDWKAIWPELAEHPDAPPIATGAPEQPQAEAV